MENQQDSLTRRQRDVLEALRAHEAAGGEPPTLDELCSMLGLRSRGSLHKHVQALVDAGLLEAPAGLRRGLRLTRSAEPGESELPLLGVIAAGAPIEAVDVPETVSVPSWMRSRAPCYVLRVRGDSMIDEGILNGDWVVVEQRDSARNGEIVVALIDGWEATLKRIEQHPGRVVLHPANPALEPMVFEPGRVQIRGVVVGQMRRYR
jgi:repressor LexA